MRLIFMATSARTCNPYRRRGIVASPGLNQILRGWR